MTALSMAGAFRPECLANGVLPGNCIRVPQAVHWARSHVRGGTAFDRARRPQTEPLVRSSNADVLAFYATLEYLQDDVVSLGKRLIHDQTP